jgi:predicted ATP-grasp superfamily ATP-dependent carboligase
LLCDVGLKAGGVEEASSTLIAAHKVVLAANSEYFRAMFDNDMAEARKDEIVIEDVDDGALKALVDFCYSGKLAVGKDRVHDLVQPAAMMQFNEIKAS